MLLSLFSAIGNFRRKIGFFCLKNIVMITIFGEFRQFSAKKLDFLLEKQCHDKFLYMRWQYSESKAPIFLPNYTTKFFYKLIKLVPYPRPFKLISNFVEMPLKTHLTRYYIDALNCLSHIKTIFKTETTAGTKVCTFRFKAY
jgi:hypothetical protein